MLRTILIDDEQLAIDNLTVLLAQYCPQIEIMSTWTNPTDGMWAIRRKQPDLVFLDAKMPRLDGFGVLDGLRDLLSVIFVTAHDEFALRAFRYSAIDYLLKPIDAKELIQSVAKVEKQQPITVPQLDHLRNQVDKPNLHPDTIILPFQNGFVFVPLKDVLYCAAEDNYTIFHTAAGQQYLKTKPLKYIEELLEERGFLRVHKSYLVNLQHVRKFVRSDSHMLMSNDTIIPVSRGHKERIIERFGWL